MTVIVAPALSVAQRAARLRALHPDRWVWLSPVADLERYRADCGRLGLAVTVLDLTPTDERIAA